MREPQCVELSLVAVYGAGGSDCAQAGFAASLAARCAPPPPHAHHEVVRHKEAHVAGAQHLIGVCRREGGPRAAHDDLGAGLALLGARQERAQRREHGEGRRPVAAAVRGLRARHDVITRCGYCLEPLSSRFSRAVTLVGQVTLVGAVDCALIVFVVVFAGLGMF